MRSWAFLGFSEQYFNDVPVFQIYEVVNSESVPEKAPFAYTEMLRLKRQAMGEYMIEDPAGCEAHWEECPGHVLKSWYCVDGCFLSWAGIERCRRIGKLDVPAQPRFQMFRVFSFFGMDNYRVCDVKLDIDNNTIDDLKRSVVSNYGGRVDLGIRASGGDPDESPRYFQSIDRLVYTTFSSSSYITSLLQKKTGDWRHFINLLWAAVSTAHTVAKVPDSQKFPLLEDGKLISEYNLDPVFPIVASWQVDPGPQWGPDWKYEAFDVFMDIVSDAVG